MQAGDDPRRKSREPQPGAKLRAKLVGQDAESHAFLAATETAGLQLGTDHTRANHKIICVSTALKEFQQYGPDIYTEGLRAITEAWEGDPNSLRAGIMQGVMRFIALYKDVYRYERLVKRLATVYPMKLVRDADAMSGAVSSQLGDSGPVHRRGHYRHPGQKAALFSADDRRRPAGPVRPDCDP